jgi:hypothetical protein
MYFNVDVVRWGKIELGDAYYSTSNHQKRCEAVKTGDNHSLQRLHKERDDADESDHNAPAAAKGGIGCL